MNNGPLVLCFLAHFPKHGLANDQKIPDRLRDMVDGEPFAGMFWPLTLELTHLGKGSPKWAKHPTIAPLRSLHDAKVSIIDWSAPPKVFSRRLYDGDDDGDGGAVDILPKFAIEDYGSDYTEDDEDWNEEEHGEDNESGPSPMPPWSKDI